MSALVKNDKRPIIAKMTDVLKDEPHGKLFSYDELEKMACTSLREDRSIIGSIQNKLMRYHAKVLSNVRGIGYKILNMNEIADETDKLRKSGFNKFRKSEIMNETVDLSDLTEIERDEFIKSKIKNAILITVYKTVERDKSIKKLPGSQLALPDKTQILDLILKKGAK